jgi:hypothetical protein
VLVHAWNNARKGDKGGVGIPEIDKDGGGIPEVGKKKQSEAMGHKSDKDALIQNKDSHDNGSKIKLKSEWPSYLCTTFYIWSPRTNLMKFIFHNLSIKLSVILVFPLQSPVSHRCNSW